ncbi:MAG TPA: hypothetical protein VNH15_07095 [Elusimicrobiota bacterium]|nr:hypothetical protein [Elusimicrobiota bacterium]
MTTKYQRSHNDPRAHSLKKKVYKIKDLLAAVKPEHLHPETGGGRLAGRELL